MRTCRDDPRMLPDIGNAGIFQLLFQPGELARELLPHGPGHLEFEQEGAGLDVADNALELTEIAEIGCDGIADLADYWHVDQHPERRNSGGPTREGAWLSPSVGNVTGVSQLNVEVGPKRLELAHELMPSAIDVALLVNASNPTAATIENGMQAAAISLGLRLHVINASSDAEVETAFAGFAQLKAGVLVIGTDAFFNGLIERLATLATRYAVPTI